MFMTGFHIIYVQWFYDFASVLQRQNFDELSVYMEVVTKTDKKTKLKIMVLWNL